jgi:nitrous oxide reductase
MSEEDRQATDLSRRRFLTQTVAAGLAAASAVGFGVEAGQATETAVNAIGAIPELAPQWKKLDLSEILPPSGVCVHRHSS